MVGIINAAMRLSAPWDGVTPSAAARSLPRAVYGLYFQFRGRCLHGTRRFPVLARAALTGFTFPPLAPRRGSLLSFHHHRTHMARLLLFPTIADYAQVGGG
jgi:hypothetical protein